MRACDYLACFGSRILSSKNEIVSCTTMAILMHQFFHKTCCLVFKVLLFFCVRYAAMDLWIFFSYRFMRSSVQHNTNKCAWRDTATNV